MNKVVIAFDIDGTLRNNTVNQMADPVANEEIRTLLITLSKFKNVEIVVWSGGGEYYARQVVRAFGLEKYVDRYADKKLRRTGNYTEDGLNEIVEFHPEIKPDIAIDDIQDCQLGAVNLIVRQK